MYKWFKHYMTVIRHRENFLFIPTEQSNRLHLKTFISFQQIIANILHFISQQYYIL